MADRTVWIGHPATVEKIKRAAPLVFGMCYPRLIVDPSMIITKRRHKRKRIHKKWAKKYFKPDPRIYEIKQPNMTMHWRVK